MSAALSSCEREAAAASLLSSSFLAPAPSAINRQAVAAVAQVTAMYEARIASMQREMASMRAAEVAQEARVERMQQELDDSRSAEETAVDEAEMLRGELARERAQSETERKGLKNRLNEAERECVSLNQQIVGYVTRLAREQGEKKREEKKFWRREVQLMNALNDAGLEIPVSQENKGRNGLVKNGPDVNVLYVNATADAVTQDSNERNPFEAEAPAEEQLEHPEQAADVNAREHHTITQPGTLPNPFVAEAQAEEQLPEQPEQAADVDDREHRITAPPGTPPNPEYPPYMPPRGWIEQKDHSYMVWKYDQREPESDDEDETLDDAMQPSAQHFMSSSPCARAKRRQDRRNGVPGASSPPSSPPELTEPNYWS
ncbi:hypothetical protein HK102_011103 [Quaeritorhiza haematococci]|nr:hypothetical protein HK102_011103 [Quaeritorhiza haematococci]